MSKVEALQLGAAVLFPLALMMVLMATVARQRGRTRREIAIGLVAIAACLGGVIATGLGLSVMRGGPLFDYGAGSFSLGTIKALDLVGLLVCAALLVIALRLSKWLTRERDGDLPPDPLPSEGGEGPSQEG